MGLKTLDLQQSRKGFGHSKRLPEKEELRACCNWESIISLLDGVQGGRIPRLLQREKAPLPAVDMPDAEIDAKRRKA